jgi:ribonucleotide reductase alpha subunit
VRNQIIGDRGSVQNVSCLSQEIKDLYKTVWEIKQKAIIDQAADRGAFICQSQSLNIHMAEPTTARLTSMHFYAWKRGLKTGMYYLRTRPKADAIQFTVDQTALAKSKQADLDAKKLLDNKTENKIVLPPVNDENTNMSNQVFIYKCTYIYIDIHAYISLPIFIYIEVCIYHITITIITTNSITIIIIN